MKIKVYEGLNIIFSVQFKKIEILIDYYDSCIFLGNIKSDKIEISKRIRLILLRKFKIFNWNSYGKNLAHIKFLVKYSPILSKFVDPSEFDNIEFINLHGNINSMWKDAYYIEFSENVKFFNTEETEIDVDTKTLYINIDPKFSQILKSFEK